MRTLGARDLDPRISACSRCGGAPEDWTPGCVTCRERHRLRALRSGDERQLIKYHTQARGNFLASVQERSRRHRDGELPLPARDESGKWVAA